MTPAHILYHNRRMSACESRYNNTFFSVIDSEVKAYYLGLLFADGSVSGRNNCVSIALKAEDSHLIRGFDASLHPRLL